jgi:Rab GDP dissociation inhibitor
VYEPRSDGSLDGCFISKGYDETSHFEGLTADVLDMYRRITGKALEMNTDTAAAAGGGGQ